MFDYINSWLLYIIFAVIGFLPLFCWYQLKVFAYWQELGVPSIPVDSWLFGNITKHAMKKCSWTELVIEFYDRFKPYGFGGIFLFRKPVLVVCDRDLVEKVLVEDFPYMHDRFSPNMTKDLFTEALSQTTGKKWRMMRSKLLPAFTTGKVRGMFDQILSSCNHTLSQVTANRTSVNIETLALSFAVETIASCSFGIELLSDPENKKRFERVLKIMSDPRQLLKISLVSMKPELFTLLWRNILNDEITEYFTDMTRGAIQFREFNRLHRNDFLQMMMTLKQQEQNDRRLGNSGSSDASMSSSRVFTQECIASQMFSFVHTGSTPTRVTISFVLFELSKNAVIQKIVQKDIDSAISKHNGWSFEAVKDMNYLDQVIQETMRLHTYMPNLLRTVVEPYTLPGTNVTLEKGTWVCIPVVAIHRDPQYYPSPERFDPNRFAGNNYKPSPNYMPFGHGPRICISIKYAVFMVKIFLARFLSQYEVKPSRKMKSPVTFDPTIVFPQVEGGIWLTLLERPVGSQGK